MNQLKNVLLIVTLAAVGIATPEFFGTTSVGTLAVAAIVGGCECDCGCGPCACEQPCKCGGCRAKRKAGRKAKCPKCECDSCTLELEHYEEDRVCFQTEQKIVCIPPVRFPWDKCCPPGRTNKTRTVNVLKFHKYKCKVCGYKWKVDPMPEPAPACEEGAPLETPPQEAAAQPLPVEPVHADETQADPTVIDPTVGPIEAAGTPAMEAPQPMFEPPVAGDVPTPPGG